MSRDYLFMKVEVFGVIEHQRAQMNAAIQGMQSNVVLNTPVEDLPDGFQADVESSQQLPRYTGADMDDPDRPEIDHFENCPVCGELIDMRDLVQVIAHMHGQKPDPESDKH
jgi:hypothetical protein